MTRPGEEGSSGAGGPLAGIRIIEMAGIGPAPFAAMMLADNGAEVVHVHRPGQRPQTGDVMLRSRRFVGLDLKTEDGARQVRELARSADGLIEGFRPGVMERLGLGPDVLLRDNPRLAYGRMTGWGQSGPLAKTAGHDLNYLAVAGVLAHLGRAGDTPTPPINLLGDFGGGGMLLAFGMLCAILKARETGSGQVVDCAITDGSAALMAMIWGYRHQKRWSNERGSNMLDTGAPFYDCYRCADGAFVSFAAIEAKFLSNFLDIAGVSAEFDVAAFADPAHWPALRARLQALFLTRTRDAWCAAMEMADTCIAPVLTMDEALAHPHNVDRKTFVEVDGVVQPAACPRFSTTPAPGPRPSSDWAAAE